MFTGPVGPVEVFFYWPEAIFGNLHWPGVTSSLLASSPGTDSLYQLIQSEGLILSSFPTHECDCIFLALQKMGQTGFWSVSIKNF